MTARRPQQLPELAGGFTLIELLITIGIAAVLALLGFSGWGAYQGFATRAVCSNNLRNLGAAVNMYCGDHSGYFPAYEQYTSQGVMWFFGFEDSSGSNAEGDRDLDVSAGPLYPYIQVVGKIEICPAFDYSTSLWKAKFKGASYGYGYNWILGGTTTGSPMNMAQLSSGADVILFGDCGQVNTFQSPASASHPMMEEFYLIDQRDKTIHFRHNNHANILFVDGHVESWAPYPGTTDKRVKGQLFGRITPVGSLDKLK